MMQMVDCTKEYEKMRAELTLIRAILHLNPVHDPVAAVAKLYEEGREAFEKMRGPKCEYSASWQPHS